MIFSSFTDNKAPITEAKLALHAASGRPWILFGVPILIWFDKNLDDSSDSPVNWELPPEKTTFDFKKWEYGVWFMCFSISSKISETLALIISFTISNETVWNELELLSSRFAILICSFEENEQINIANLDESN